ncbi:MAG: alginate export family protein [Syntrophales bacterium]
MKRLLVVLLALGLIVAFGATASAADVKFSGQYYVVGVYENNRTLQDTDHTYSKAYFWNRARVQTVFQVAQGLSFTTRFDAFEKQWGAVNRSANNNEDKSNSGKVNSTSVALQENIEMEHAYVTFATKVGQFQIGYQAADEWGTVFGDTPGSRPRAKYTGAFGPVNVIGIYQKDYEADTIRLNAATGGGTPSGLVDGDVDKYMLAGIYNWKGGAAGLLYVYTNGASNRATANMRTQIHTLAPYMKATFGPVYVEAEVIWLSGKTRKYESPSTAADMDKEGLGAYALARMKFGPAYVGAQVGYSSGDPNNTEKDKSGPASSTSWKPFLIFGEANLTVWNYGRALGIGNPNVTAAQNTTNNKQNIWIWQGHAGFNPTPKINVEGAVGLAYADKKPNNFVSKQYGWEADIKASYKIYDNLTYMVGAGYLWTGDYFKGTSDNNKVGNDYLLMNQLTLNF